MNLKICFLSFLHPYHVHYSGRYLATFLRARPSFTTKSAANLSFLFETSKFFFDFFYIFPYFLSKKHKKTLLSLKIRMLSLYFMHLLNIPRAYIFIYLY